MMRHLQSEELGDLAAIYDTDIELVSITRPESKRLAALAEHLSVTRQVVAAQWEQTADDVDAPARALLPQIRQFSQVETSPKIEDQWLDALNEEILELADVLNTLLGCDRIGVRLATLNAPMCPRFHVDQIPCRLLSTIRGPGTQWISSDDVDRALFADRNDDSLPVRAGKSFKEIAAGSWSLLKGGAWDDNFTGVVHRSPHQRDERLLLSMDPIFSN